jgi:serine/threonine protein kinase
MLAHCSSSNARGLATAHEKGIVHRDLKSENLFVTKDGRIKILDFGLAQLTQPQPNSVASLRTASHETTPGSVMGTIGYMSPELVRGQAADPRSDIFAFGAVLFEILTGNRAFHRETSADTMSAILNQDPIPNKVELHYLEVARSKPGGSHFVFGSRADGISPSAVVEPAAAKATG